jgi:MerC mercury resistance protein
MHEITEVKYLHHCCKLTKFAEITYMAIRVNWDIMGIATSLACAVHCAVLPIVLTTLPVFGINIIHNSFFEWGMIALAFFVGGYSLFNGYTRHHHTTLPLLIFFTGFIFLILKQFFPHQEYLFLVLAVFFIISAHLLNFLCCRFNKVRSS